MKKLERSIKITFVALFSAATLFAFTNSDPIFPKIEIPKTGGAEPYNWSFSNLGLPQSDPLLKKMSVNVSSYLEYEGRLWDNGFPPRKVVFDSIGRVVFSTEGIIGNPTSVSTTKIVYEDNIAIKRTTQFALKPDSVIEIEVNLSRDTTPVTPTRGATATYFRTTFVEGIARSDSSRVIFRYDRLNRLQEISEANFNNFPTWPVSVIKHLYAYDSTGKILSLTKYEGGLAGVIVKSRTVFERSDSSLTETVLVGLSEETLNDKTQSEMSRTIKKFNKSGLVIQMLYQEKNTFTGWRTNHTIDYTYDSSNKLTSRSYDGIPFVIGYDSKGRITSWKSIEEFGKNVFTNQYENATSCETSRDKTVMSCVSASPNPFNPSTSISFSLTNAGKVKCAILDAQGRLVRNLTNGNLSAGSHSLRWDGRNENGKAVPSNMYFAILTTPQGTTKTRLLLMK
ncbi:MAG: T9SS type A sorting domain-containing protein [Fibrobacteres bacterium]|nr:T9SS type A sorting domain-containing protein [Fibrobacterota bacterium]